MKYFSSVKYMRSRPLACDWTSSKVEPFTRYFKISPNFFISDLLNQHSFANIFVPWNISVSRTVTSYWTFSKLEPYNKHFKLTKFLKFDSVINFLSNIVAQWNLSVSRSVSKLLSILKVELYSRHFKMLKFQIFPWSNQRFNKTFYYSEI